MHAQTLNNQQGEKATTVANRYPPVWNPAVQIERSRRGGQFLTSVFGVNVVPVDSEASSNKCWEDEPFSLESSLAQRRFGFNQISKKSSAQILIGLLVLLLSQFSSIPFFLHRLHFTIFPQSKAER